MILKYSLLSLLAVTIVTGEPLYNGSTTAAAVVSGGILKAKHQIDNKKYQRKDCPVCKGKGWYISGDGIKRVECGYCVPDNELISPEPKSVLKKDQNCENGICVPSSTRRL